MTTLPHPVTATTLTSTDQAGARLSSLATPLRLGILQAAVCLLLTLVELAEPPARPGFAGIAFSNAINSPGAWNGLLLFQDAFDWLPGVAPGRSLSPTTYLFWRRGGIVLLALLQVAALLGCLTPVGRRAPASTWRWLAGPLLGSVALLAYPPINTDVFYYAASARVAAIGANPYLTAPLAIPGDPFAPFNDWASITTPYGPVWTTLSRAVYAVTGDDPVRAALGFKLLAATAALGVAWLTIHLANRLTGNRAVALAAGVLVGWQPALLLESGGTAHLDPTMMLLALGGLLLLASGRRGGVRSGLLLLAASALIKPVTLPLLGLAALGRLWTSDPIPVIFRRWLGDIAAILALAAACFAPYWSGGDLARVLVTQGKLLYVDEPFGVNPLWYWLLPELPGMPTGDDWVDLADLTLRPGTQAATILLLVWSLFLVIRAAIAARRTRPITAEAPRREPSNSLSAPSITPRRTPHPAVAMTDPLPTVVRSWAIAAATLALVPINAHAWYAIWAVAPVALAWSLHTTRNTQNETHPRPIPWWLWLYLAWSLAAFLIYHTAVWSGPST